MAGRSPSNRMGLPRIRFQRTYRCDGTRAVAEANSMKARQAWSGLRHLGSRGRIAGVAVATVIGLLLMPGSQSPARAWLNGLPQKPNSFGTHDWVLLMAVKAVKAKGRWVNLRLALQATDDPDSIRDIPYASPRVLLPFRALTCGSSVGRQGIEP
jgi:hypothetical protein